MNLQVTIGFNAEALSAISSLTDAIRAIGGGTGTTTIAHSETSATGSDEPIYWQENEADDSTGAFGVAHSKAEYAAVKKAHPNAYKIPDNVYRERLAVEKRLAELKPDGKSKAGQESDVEATDAPEETTVSRRPAAKPKAKATAKPKAKAAEPADAPTEEDLIAVFQAYLPGDLSKPERAERREFVKPILARFGVSKATELAEEDRALAINLVQRKMAGEDVDPATDEFAAVSASDDAEDDMI